MPSIGTMFRAVIMIAVGIGAVKGWQLYGPPAGEMKALAVRALQAAQAALEPGTNGASNQAALVADPRVAPAMAPDAESAPAPAPPLLPDAAHTAAEPSGPTTAGEHAAPASILPIAAEEPSGGAEDEAARLPELLARLEGLGVADPQLVPWGSSGQFYRFRCRAALAEMPAHSRHFEAIAEQPIAAVEQVLAKVETWRSAGDRRGISQ